MTTHLVAALETTAPTSTKSNGTSAFATAVPASPSPPLTLCCVSADDFAGQAFDFLVIGGGTAGLAVASRLAAATSLPLTVGVVEAGGVVAASSLDQVQIPGMYGHALGGCLDWGFETAPQAGLHGRSLPWPRGRVLGGTSAINFMTWNRASRADYDAWESLGNPGWGWDGLL